MVRWHIITGEYPPQPGGVSDYTRLVARGLAERGRKVHVWAPSRGQSEVESGSGVVVHRLADGFGPRGLRELDAGLGTPTGNNRLLVQYVPHSFGYRSMNLPLCTWLATRRTEQVWVMFHEVAVAFGARPIVNAVAVVHRLMASLLVNRADRVFVSIPGWIPLIEKLKFGRLACEWLPIPSTLPTVVSPDGATAVREGLAPKGGVLIGHFGTYGNLILPLLERAVSRLLEGRPERRLLLLGRGGHEARAAMLGRQPRLGEQLVAVGALSSDVLARHIAACDVMLQPYPDGLSSRRTSLMAALGLGVPVVSNRGALTDPFWLEQSVVSVCDDASADSLGRSVDRLLHDPTALRALRASTAQVYQQHFSSGRTVENLLRVGVACGDAPPCSPEREPTLGSEP